MTHPAGDYTVTVESSAGTSLEFKGYAENTTDALYKALEQREEECRNEIQT